MQEQLKRLVRPFLENRGYEIIRTATFKKFLDFRKIDLVLDVGANVGQYGQHLRSRGFTGDILSFEPIPEAVEALKSASKDDTRWQVEPVALGAEAGELPLKVSEHSVFSSFLDQTPVAQAYDERAGVERTLIVPVKTLDDYYDKIAPRRTFLKIDTQGFEQAVLQGAKRVLPTILGVQVELPVAHLYQNTWRIEEALTFFRDHGFSISQVRPVNYGKIDPTSVLELDFVFSRLLSELQS